MSAKIGGLKMPDKKPINIFISHCGEDADQLKSLHKLIQKEGYKIRDSSMDEKNPNNAKDPEYIKSLLRPKIDWAGTVIVLIGPETHNKDWVDWEVEYANASGDKNIVGVFIPGGADSDVPENFKKYGDALVTWNADKLAEAIEGQPHWMEPDGSPNKGFWRKNVSNC